MNLFWAVPLTILVVAASTSFCFWLLYKAREVDSTVWVLEHVHCPIIRILTLMVVISLVYPAISDQSSFDFWKDLADREQFNNLLNILFFASLGLAFLPLVSNPVIALPVQSILTIALVFNWQYAGTGQSLTLLPSFGLMLKILAYMLMAYVVTRQASIPLSRWLDRRFAVEGSIRMLTDTFYLVLQIPVILVYGGYLTSQLV